MESESVLNQIYTIYSENECVLPLCQTSMFANKCLMLNWSTKQQDYAVLLFYLRGSNCSSIYLHTLVRTSSCGHLDCTFDDFIFDAFIFHLLDIFCGCLLFFLLKTTNIIICSISFIKWGLRYLFETFNFRFVRRCLL